MTFNINDFLPKGNILNLPNSISYSLNNLTRVNAEYKYLDVATGNTTNYDLQIALELAKDPYRFNTGSLSAWSNVDTANITSAMAEWSKIIPVTFSSIVSGIPTITVSVLSRLKKMRRFASCFLLCFTLNFPAFSSSPGLSYYYLQEGEKIAVIHKCGLGNEEMIKKTMRCILKNVPNVSHDVEMQKEIIDAFYEGINSEPLKITPEQCVVASKNMKEHMESYDEDCNNK